MSKSGLIVTGENTIQSEVLPVSYFRNPGESDKDFVVRAKEYHQELLATVGRLKILLDS